MRRKLVGGLPAERSRQRRDICPWAAGHPAQHAGRRSSRRRCTCRSGTTDGQEMSRVTRPSAREPGVAAVTLPPATSRRPGRGRHPRRRCRSCPSTPRGIDTPVPGTASPRRGRRTRPCGNLPAPEPTEVVAPRADVQASTAGHRVDRLVHPHAPDRGLGSGVLHGGLHGLLRGRRFIDHLPPGFGHGDPAVAPGQSWRPRWGLHRRRRRRPGGRTRRWAGATCSPDDRRGPSVPG